MNVLLFVLAMLALAAAVGFGLLASRLLREERRRSAARVAALSEALDGPAIHGAAPTFHFEGGTSVQGHPLIKAAVVGVMAVVLVVVAAMGNREHAASPAAAAAAQAPLELMAMQHAREGTTLTVTGRVRNPGRGADARRVTAVVVAFDRAGDLVARGQALLDVLVLEPGRESPFVVMLPEAPEVARYRVSFRSGRGMIGHIDRRSRQTQLVQR